MMPTPNTNSTEPIKRRLVPLREAAMAISVAPRRLAALARAGVVPRVEVSTRLHLYDIDALVEALKSHNP
mgnify:CR=1 FL=1